MMKLGPKMLSTLLIFDVRLSLPNMIQVEQAYFFSGNSINKSTL